jgi:hypothetical protein
MGCGAQFIEVEKTPQQPEERKRKEGEGWIEQSGDVGIGGAAKVRRVGANLAAYKYCSPKRCAPGRWLALGRCSQKQVGDDEGHGLGVMQVG